MEIKNKIKMIENKAVQKNLEKILGILLLFVAILKLTTLNTENYINLCFDVILVFIVMGFSLSFIFNKK